MVPLSEEEQRLLEQMEEALAAEDPKFVSALRGSSARTRHKRLTALGVAGFLVGIAVLMTGAVLKQEIVAVVGFVVMLAMAYVALINFRRLGSDQDLPDNVHRIGDAKGGSGKATAPRQSGFMNRMEDRWRRRRDEF
jgi:membrane protein implicated in regulation of membrane protease activity